MLGAVRNFVANPAGRHVSASSSSIFNQSNPRTLPQFNNTAVNSARQLHTLSRPNRVFYDKFIASFHRPGMPSTFKVTADRPWYPRRILEWEVMPRDEFGVPAHIPPDVSTTIAHTYHVPPEYFPFLKKLGEETPSMKPWMEKLIKGKMTFPDYEEMFYSHAKPLRVHRSKLALPYRTEEEVAKSKEIDWESKWMSFRQRVRGEYYTRYYFREWFLGMLIALWIVQMVGTQVAFYCEDMRLFYLEAPEHKINWVVPRGDL
ncbi:unnamed protein product [Amoebophrya sp. A120]|nr:unnamed protein product [Amoebophrya sp. A120]|eukprot:GSA120T00006610001.1